MQLSKKEIKVRKALTDIYPQLVINCQNVCGAAYKTYGNDLLSVAVEFFLDKEVDYQLKVIADGKLEHYITKIMNFQLKLGTTRFWHHYRKPAEKSRELYTNYDYGPRFKTYNTAFQDELSDCAICIQEYVEKLDPYLKMLFKERIMEKNKWVDISRKYNNISYGNLKKDTEELQVKIKQKCGHLL
jgi:hypothetical protein